MMTYWCVHSTNTIKTMYMEYPFVTFGLFVYFHWGSSGFQILWSNVHLHTFVKPIAVCIIAIQMILNVTRRLPSWSVSYVVTTFTEKKYPQNIGNLMFLWKICKWSMYWVLYKYFKNISKILYTAVVWSQLRKIVF